MDTFSASLKKHAKLNEKKQVQAGTPVSGVVTDDHKVFLETLFSLLDSGKIDPFEPKTFLKKKVYESLSDEWQDKVDLSLANIAHQIRIIQSMRSAGDTVHVKTMVEQLWQMKQRIEEHHDAFVF